MKTRFAGRVVKLFSAVLLFAGATSAHAMAVDFGTASDGTYGFGRVVGLGESFTDYVSFDLDTPAEVTSFIQSFDLSLRCLDLLGIDKFTTGLEKFGSGTYSSIAALISGSATSGGLLGPGAYRLAVSGVGSGRFGGLYAGVFSVTTVPVPEPDAWAMLLMGLILAGYQLRRRQRSLE